MKQESQVTNGERGFIAVLLQTLIVVAAIYGVSLIEGCSGSPRPTAVPVENQPEKVNTPCWYCHDVKPLSYPIVILPRSPEVPLIGGEHDRSAFVDSLIAKEGN